MFPTITFIPASNLLTVKFALTVALANFASPSYLTVTVYLPGARPATFNVATPLTGVTVSVLPLTVIDTVPVVVGLIVTTIVALLP